MSYVASKNNASFASHLFGKTKLSLSPWNHGRILFLKYSYKTSDESSNMQGFFN
jgi:hypothetical protein